MTSTLVERHSHLYGNKNKSVSLDSVSGAIIKRLGADKKLLYGAPLARAGGSIRLLVRDVGSGVVYDVVMFGDVIRELKELRDEGWPYWSASYTETIISTITNKYKPWRVLTKAIKDHGTVEFYTRYDVDNRIYHITPIVVVAATGESTHQSVAPIRIAISELSAEWNVATERASAPKCDDPNELSQKILRAALPNTKSTPSKPLTLTRIVPLDLRYSEVDTSNRTIRFVPPGSLCGWLLRYEFDGIVGPVLRDMRYTTDGGITHKLVLSKLSVGDLQWHRTDPRYPSPVSLFSDRFYRDTIYCGMNTPGMYWIKCDLLDETGELKTVEHAIGISESCTDIKVCFAYISPIAESFRVIITLGVDGDLTIGTTLTGKPIHSLAEPAPWDEFGESVGAGNTTLSKPTHVWSATWRLEWPSSIAPTTITPSSLKQSNTNTQGVGYIVLKESYAPTTKRPPYWSIDQYLVNLSSGLTKLNPRWSPSNYLHYPLLLTNTSDEYKASMALASPSPLEATGSVSWFTSSTPTLSDELQLHLRRKV